jgi:hypothetical protein
MKITLYFIGWNDKFYLPFIKQHYGKFCQRIVYYDNYSNDGSQELARELGFEVRNFGYSNRLDDQDYLNVKNHCWKEERENGQQADYVIVCDADEFICIDDLRGTAPKVVGFNLISDRLPTNKITDINTGSFSINYSKQAIFSPREILEINFVHGCHLNHIQGNVTSEGSCRLLHFRQIGGVDRLIERHAQYRERMSKFNLKHGMGSHYLHSDDQKRIEWAELQSKAVELW